MLMPNVSDPRADDAATGTEIKQGQKMTHSISKPPPQRPMMRLLPHQLRPAMH
jgi:hypothetical protein